ncbi:DUF6262 family protein [Mycobacteroides abscessus]|uniref:DUF6262 family protein n=1 Tax=Mycobacteroides abscessus TaxID=36809 RepID=UPI001055E408|nr:DUF6262 family protein [Mycobacteroides abscessus]
MTKQLREAAQRRHEDALQRASEAIVALTKAAEPITFASVARKAGTSTDFLYRQTDLRSRIEDLRVTSLPGKRSSPPAEEPSETSSAAVRALASKLKDLRRSHNEEVNTLKKALAVAQGENLILRRRLALHE